MFAASQLSHAEKIQEKHLGPGYLGEKSQQFGEEVAGISCDKISVKLIISVLSGTKCEKSGSVGPSGYESKSEFCFRQI